MRLRWGPHASELAEQVVLRDPYYVVQVLDEQPGGVLAAVFRNLILAFDARPLKATCARCGRPANGLCAYPASVQLIGYCDRCALISPTALPSAAVRINGYEDALRHVASSFPRGHRANMRRIITRVTQAKAGPAQVTEPAARFFFNNPSTSLQISCRAVAPANTPAERRS